MHLAGDGEERTGYVDEVAVRGDRRGLGPEVTSSWVNRGIDL